MVACIIHYNARLWWQLICTKVFKVFQDPRVRSVKLDPVVRLENKVILDPLALPANLDPQVDLVASDPLDPEDPLATMVYPETLVKLDLSVPLVFKVSPVKLDPVVFPDPKENLDPVVNVLKLFSCLLLSKLASNLPM